MKIKDVFISHASEDKALLALPLYKSLQNKNLTVWIDKEDINQSDSLFYKINKGLKDTENYIVIISPSFIKNNWTEKELNAIYTQHTEKNKKIFIILHNLNIEKFKTEYTLLSDLLIFESQIGIEIISKKISNIINKKIINNNSKETISIRNKSFKKKQTYYDIPQNIELFIDIIVNTNGLEDKLLFKEKLSPIDDELFIKLETFLEALFKKNYSLRNFNNETITSLINFRIILISTLIMIKPDGYKKWFIKKTVYAIKHKKLQNSIIKEVWNYIYEQYFINNKKEFQKIIKLVFVVPSNQSSNNYSDFIYTFFNFFYELIKKDKILIQIMFKFLEKYSQEQEENAELLPNNFFITIKRLLEKCINISHINHFFPKVQNIEINKYNISYTFNSMIVPLTNHDYFKIMGSLPKNKKNLLTPYILGTSKTEKDKYEYVKQQIETILNHLEKEDNSYKWDIPTIPEWLILSDCENNLYPWGNSIPTRKQANLYFGNKNYSTLKPVGSYPLGKTKKSIYDCCGNIHEIVYSSLKEKKFKLMGGCFIDYFKSLSCQNIKSFYPIEHKKNVGIRLISYKKTDIEKRKKIVKYFLKTNSIEIS